jgi:DNA polymerase I-like protein with 3'-5' exonuclease and polymerase domains
MHVVAVDTETTGVLWHDTAFCVTTAEDYGAGIDTRFWDLKDDPTELQGYLGRGVALVGHNIKFDLQKLLYAYIIDWDKVQPENIHDTMVMAHLINENGSRKLKDLARDILGETTDEEATLKEYRRKAGLTISDGYDKIPIEILKPYAMKDAEFTLRLYKFLLPKIKSEPELWSLYKQEIAVLVTVLRVETAGMRVDKSVLSDGIKEYGTRILQAKQKIRTLTGKTIFDEKDLEPRPLQEPVYTKAGKLSRTHETRAQAAERVRTNSFNPNSPIQIQEQFESMGVTMDKTDKNSLESLDNPLGHAILELREATKVRSTYLLGIQEEMGKDCILHPNFRTTGTVTGRMSSGSG